MAEVAEHRYAPEGYHDFIGFEVSKPLLERAFLKTYGVPLRDVASTVDLSLGSYRRSVASMIPGDDQGGLAGKKEGIDEGGAGPDEAQIRLRAAAIELQKEWGTNYGKPGLGARFLAFLFEIVPKVGPFKALGFNAPTPATQKLFMESFVSSLKEYQGQLTLIKGKQAFTLADTNLDTGKPSKFGEYKLADEACSKLLIKMQDHKSDVVDADLRQGLLDFYGNGIPLDPKAAQELSQVRNQPTPAATVADSDVPTL